MSSSSSDSLTFDEPSSPSPLVENSTRIVWALAWPAVALNSLQVINNLLDTTFIGHLPEAAMTAQSGSMSVMFLMFSLAMALGTASTALVSRAYGADKLQDVRTAVRKCLSLGFGLGVVFTGLTMLLAHPSALLLLPGKDVAAIKLMTQFLMIYGLGLPAVYLIQTLAGAMRGVGDTKSPMVISGIQILLHICLNYILIFPPRVTAFGLHLPGANMGLLGAATALAASAWLSALAYLLYSGRTPLGEAWRFGMLDRHWVDRILKIAIPSAVMAVLRVASLAVFTIALKTVDNGSAAIAGMRAGFAVESIMFMPAFGLAMASAALVGQSLGMKKPERAERLAWKAAHHAALVTAALAVPIFIGAQQVAELMIQNKPQIAAEAASLIRWLCFTEIFFAYAMVMIGAMQGAGDTVRPMWITVIALWFLRVPLTFLFAAGFAMGSNGAWFAMSLSQAVQGVLAIIAFKQGHWKTKEV